MMASWYIRGVLRTTALGVCLASPSLVFAQATIQSIIFGFGQALQPLVAVGIGAAVMVFVWGLVSFLTRAGDNTAAQEARQRMVWGVIGLFMVVAIWGIVAILNTLIGVSGVNACPPPQIGGDAVSTCF